MNKPISGYHKDEQDHWVAELNCGHNQHVRHSPPFVNRPWVESQAGRETMIGYELNCVKCDAGTLADRIDLVTIHEAAPEDR
jgi:hypothetical protein